MFCLSDRQTDRQTARQKDRQKDRHRQTDRQTDGKVTYAFLILKVSNILTYPQAIEPIRPVEGYHFLPHPMPILLIQCPNLVLIMTDPIEPIPIQRQPHVSRIQPGDDEHLLPLIIDGHHEFVSVVDEVEALFGQVDVNVGREETGVLEDGLGVLAGDGAPTDCRIDDPRSVEDITWAGN